MYPGAQLPVFSEILLTFFHLKKLGKPENFNFYQFLQKNVM